MSGIFAYPYDSQIALLFDGQNSLEQIAQALPRSPSDLFRSDFLQSALAGKHPFAWELRENNTANITPRAPVRLYYGESDVDVFPANTKAAFSAMRSAGVQVIAVDLGANADHSLSADLGLRAARAWFDTIANQGEVIRSTAPPRIE